MYSSMNSPVYICYLDASKELLLVRLIGPISRVGLDRV